MKQARDHGWRRTQEETSKSQVDSMNEASNTHDEGTRQALRSEEVSKCHAGNMDEANNMDDKGAKQSIRSEEIGEVSNMDEARKLSMPSSFLSGIL